MEWPFLADLEAEFQLAKSSRSGARSIIHTLDELQEELCQQADAAEQEAKACQTRRDQAHQLMVRNRVARRFEKARQKAEKRNNHGAAAHDARVAYRQLRNQISQLKEQSAWLKIELDIQRREKHYYMIRHHMMEKRQQAESNNEAALEAKRTYMISAGIPISVAPEDVLYYTDGRRVHLFYGGTTSPTGSGVSSDGLGHGHIVLIKGASGVYRVQYSRDPQ